MPIIRIEYFHDLDPDNPRAYEVFTYRMALLQHEYDAWQTVVLDSLTFAELTARKRHEKILNPMEIELGQGLRECGTDTLKNSEWCG